MVYMTLYLAKVGKQFQLCFQELTVLFLATLLI